ncbi:MAG: PAS domain S-box protein, partial [Planctomycetaceae bacterium]|nr:PAS domain S-box protein [Planctomycetaceae bacterium]
MGSWQDNFVNTFPDAIVVVDRRGVIRQWNSRAEEYFGWCAAEAIGASVDSRISVSRVSDSAARDWNFLREQIGAGRSLRTILQARGRGGETCSFELTAFSQPDDQVLIACFREWHSPLQDDGHPKELPANAIEFSGSGDRFPLIPTPIEQEKSTSEAFRSCLEVVCKEIDWPWAHGWIV